MNQDLISAILLARVCDEVSERINTPIRGDKRYRPVVYYRSAISIVFREEYGMTYDAIASEMKKNHATIINSYKRGKELIELGYDDFIKICEDVKAMMSYYEVTMGISGDPVILIAEELYQLAVKRFDEEDVSKHGQKLAIYNFIDKIKYKIL